MSSSQYASGTAELGCPRGAAGVVAAKIEYLNPGGSAKDRIAGKWISDRLGSSCDSTGRPILDVRTAGWSGRYGDAMSNTAIDPVRAVAPERWQRSEAADALVSVSPRPHDKAMDKLGTSLELLGAIVTGGGLMWAWSRASGRFKKWRTKVEEGLNRANHRLKRISGGVTHELQAALDVHVGMRASAEVTKNQPLADRVAAIERTFDALKTSVGANTPASLQDKLEEEIQEEFAELQSLENAIAVRDIAVALIGLLITFVGTALGLWAALSIYR